MFWVALTTFLLLVFFALVIAPLIIGTLNHNEVGIAEPRSQGRDLRKHVGNTSTR